MMEHVLRVPKCERKAEASRPSRHDAESMRSNLGNLTAFARERHYPLWESDRMVCHKYLHVSQLDKGCYMYFRRNARGI